VAAAILTAGIGAGYEVSTALAALQALDKPCGTGRRQNSTEQHFHQHVSEKNDHARNIE
jgi:hypothetical protein